MVLLTLSSLACYVEQEEKKEHAATLVAIRLVKEAMTALSEDDYETALEKADEAIQDDPAYTVAYSTKAHALARLERYPEAIAAAQQACNLVPEASQLWFFLGAYQDKAQQPAAAKESYKKGLACFDAQYPADSLAPEQALERAIVMYLYQGKMAGIREINNVISQYPEYRKARLFKERILRGDRDYFLWWADAPRESEADGASAS